MGVDWNNLFDFLTFIALHLDNRIAKFRLFVYLWIVNILSFYHLIFISHFNTLIIDTDLYES